MKRVYSGHQGQGILHFVRIILLLICCGTFGLCVSPLVALWPLPNLCLTLWRHSAFWGSPLSDLINHNTSSQAAGSPSFSGRCCIVFSLSLSLHRYAALILLFRSSSFSLNTPSKLTLSLISVRLPNLTNYTVFLHVAAQQINIIDGEFLYHCLAFTCSTPSPSHNSFHTVFFRGLDVRKVLLEMHQHRQQRQLFVTFN